jgi:hypothetical protein
MSDEPQREFLFEIQTRYPDIGMTLTVKFWDDLGEDELHLTDIQVGDLTRWFANVLNAHFNPSRDTIQEAAK